MKTLSEIILKATFLSLMFAGGDYNFRGEEGNYQNITATCILLFYLLLYGLLGLQRMVLEQFFISMLNEAALGTLKVPLMVMHLSRSP